MAKVPMIDRLQAMLDSAYAANKLERDRLPLEKFLVGLQQGALHSDEALLKQIQLAISASFFDFLNSVSNTQNAFSTSRAIQTVTATDSHAVQTDAATMSLWDLLPKARDEAYNLGLNDGKEQGRMQGIEHGTNVGIDQGLAVGFSQGNAEGLAEGLAEKEAEIARSLEMNKNTEYSSEPVEGLKQEREDAKRTGCNVSRSALEGESIRESNVLSPAQGLPKPEHRKEKMKPPSHSYDPFASIW